MKHPWFGKVCYAPDPEDQVRIIELAMEAWDVKMDYYLPWGEGAKRIRSGTEDYPCVGFYAGGELSRWESTWAATEQGLAKISRDEMLHLLLSSSLPAGNDPVTIDEY